MRATVVDVVLVVDLDVEVVVVGRATRMLTRFRLRWCLAALPTAIFTFFAAFGTVVVVTCGTTASRVLAPAVDTSFRTTGPTMPIASAATAIVAMRRRRRPATQSPPGTSINQLPPVALRRDARPIASIPTPSAASAATSERSPEPVKARLPFGGVLVVVVDPCP
ncbi:MAG TPA: hypothetical protein VIK54_11535 [Acidimicrobiia bacterium]